MFPQGDRPLGFSVRQAARLLGVSEGSVRRWSDEQEPGKKKLECSVTPGGERRFSEAQLQRFVESLEEGPRGPRPEQKSLRRLGAERDRALQRAETAERERDALRAAPPPPAVLSEREREVLALIADGYTNPEIAARMYRSVRTVESHRKSIQEKTGWTTRAQLTAYARGREAG